MNTEKHIIVNADDYGKSASLNRAILRSFELGLISTTTIMTNMPGFEEACELAYQGKLINKIGIHFNLTEGQPLTHKITRIKKFCNGSGNFFKSFKGHFFSVEEREAIFEELQAQVNKAMVLGINPTHCDSHHHVHHTLGIGKMVCRIAKMNQIPAVRLSFNWGTNISWKRKIYSKYFNERLAIASLAKTKIFCEIRNVTPELLKTNLPVEVMVHPCFDENNLITNYVNGDELKYLIETFLSGERFVTYDFLNRRDRIN